MIYVIKAPHMLPDNDALIYKIKIGYSSDEEGNGAKRLRKYSANGLTFKVLFIIPGADIFLEQRIHSYFKKYRLDKKEWYYFREEILDFFNKHKTAKEISNALPRSLSEINISHKIYLMSNYGKDKVLDNFLTEFFKLKNFKERLKYFCGHLDVLDLENNEERKVAIYFTLPVIYLNSLDILGPAKCRALGYQRSKVIDELNDLSRKSNAFSERIYSVFKEGDRYTKKMIKQTLSKINTEFGIKSTAKGY